MFKKLKRWIWLHTMTVRKYQDYMLSEGVSFKDKCYDHTTHMCDGRCQGACDCPFAQGSASKKQMMIYEIESHEHKKEMEKLHEILKNDKEFQESMKKIAKNYGKTWNADL